MFGVAWDFIAESEPITVRNRHPGGNSVPIADRYTYSNPNADRLANPERVAQPDALRCNLGRPVRLDVGLHDHMRRPRECSGWEPDRHVCKRYARHHCG